MKITSFLLTSWFFLFIGNIVLFYNIFCLVVLLWPVIPCRRWLVSRIPQILLSGNMISSVGYAFYFAYYVYELIGIVFLGLFGFGFFLISCRFLCSKFHDLAKCPFFYYFWNIDSRAGHLWFGFPIGVSQYLQFCSFGLFFGPIPYFPVSVVLCIGSSLMSSSRFDKKASGMVFFLIFSSHMFCCICSTTFDTSRPSSFSSLSLTFCRWLMI